jgi:catechol 2,3-dioxygenase-like lactoylglutathione lyase family enzyme
MSVLRIDHLNITGPPTLIAGCHAFYTQVLGLVEGARPPFRSRGHWLYAGEHAVVHLTESDRESTDSKPAALDHLALACEGLDETLERLKTHSVHYDLERVPASNQVQVFVRDPAGVSLELNFS